MPHYDMALATLPDVARLPTFKMSATTPIAEITFGRIEMARDTNSSPKMFDQADSDVAKPT